MKPFNLHKPKDVKSSLILKKAESQFIAGGTNLLDLMKKDVIQPDDIIDLSSVLSKEITETKKSIRIGANVKNSQLANHPMILKEFPLLSKAILAGASPQIRNMATVGGNILQRTRCPYFSDTSLPCNKRSPGSGCAAIAGENRSCAIVGYTKDCVATHPSDLCVALAAMDATINFTTKEGKDQSIKMEAFHTLSSAQPNKDNSLPDHAIITSVDLPKSSLNKNFEYLKIRDRDSYAFALISCAAALEIRGNKIVSASLASGGVAHKPWRWTAAEKFLKGKAPSVENFQKAAEIASSGLTPLSENGFKIPMLKAAIETALTNSIQKS